MSETGSVKFTCQQSVEDIAPFIGLEDLNAFRGKLQKLGMIGVDANGIGYGNLSVRDGATNGFYITGSGTGGFSELAPSDYARVVDYDFGKNWIHCEGSTIASSESLTHAAVYEAAPTVRSVIHCHDLKLWSTLLDKAPATGNGIEYGTPEMAREVLRLLALTEVKARKIIVMRSHEGGLVAFGKDLGEAYDVIQKEKLKC